MRLFVSVDLEPGLEEKVKEVQDRVKETGADVKMVEPENLHFTIKFLGEVPEERVREAEEIIEGSLKDVRAFRISVEGFGYFGPPAHIRTLWVDVKEGRKELLDLMGKVGGTLNQIRKDDFSRPVAHLTIGRVRSGKNREQLLKEAEALKGVKLGEMDVKEVKLKKSVLTGSGPVYSDVKVFTLSKKS